MPETHKVDISPVEEVNNLIQVGAYNLDQLVRMLLTDKMLQVDIKVKDEISLLNDRQKRVEFLNKFLRELNTKTSVSDESLDRSLLQGLIDEGMQLKADADKKLVEVTQLEEKMNALKALEPSTSNTTQIDELQKKINFNRTTALETYDTLRACDIIKEKGKDQFEPVDRKSYSERERERLVENVRSQNKMMQDLNAFQSQKIQQCNSERHETIMLAKDIAKTLHDIKKRFASNIAGR